MVGVCEVYLSNGTASLNELSCTKTSNINIGPDCKEAISCPMGAGFMSISIAFGQVFTGTIEDGNRNYEYNTSFAMIARSITNQEVTLPSDLMSHFRRTLRNIPFMLVSMADQTVPSSTTNERFVGKYWDGIMDVEQLQTFVKIEAVIFYALVGVSSFVALCCLAFLLGAKSAVGRLMVDSIIHSLTVGSVDGPSIQASSMAGLNGVLKQARDMKLVYGLLRERELEDETGARAIVGQVGVVSVPPRMRSLVKVSPPVEGRYYEGGPGGVRNDES